MAVDGIGVPPRTSRFWKSVWVFSLDVGPRSVEAGAFEVVDLGREERMKGEERQAIGATKGCEEATRRRVELATARPRGASCIGGIVIIVVLY